MFAFIDYIFKEFLIDLIFERFELSFIDPVLDDGAFDESIFDGFFDFFIVECVAIVDQSLENKFFDLKFFFDREHGPMKDFDVVGVEFLEVFVEQAFVFQQTVEDRLLGSEEGGWGGL